MAPNPIDELLKIHRLGNLISNKVLIVDDDEENLVVLETALEEKYRIYGANSGAEAIELLRKEDIDVIISDQRMPEITGVDLFRESLKIKPDTVRIILTAYSDTSAMLDAINKGEVFRFLIKPWDRDALFATLEDAFDRLRTGRAIRRLVDIVNEKNTALEKSYGELKDTQEKLIQSEKLAAMGRLTGGIIHDLKNIMTGLLMIEEEFGTNGNINKDELKEIVLIGIAGMRNFAETLKSINHFLKREELLLEKSLIDLNGVVKNVLSIVRMDLEFRKRDVVVNLKADLPPVFIDGNKISQVIINLVRNAVQATQVYGKIEITTGLYDSKIVFKVSDNGCGIPPEKLNLIFEPFASFGKEDGIGLGLYISKMIVEQHGGRIACASEQGKGTTFEIALQAERG
ncbi:MAG: response regulator [Deltaproteobacteria bacterium]|nr:response regulator [Deltaproteobacteria bacterium]